MNAAEIHRRHWATIDRYDWEGMRALYHPEYRYTDVTGTTFDDTDTPVGVMAYLHAAFPDVVFHYRDFHPSADGGTSFVEVRCVGTHLGPLGDLPATGRRVVSVACHVIEARDGLITAERDYFDMAAIGRQISGELVVGE
ncbi:nuclear transport factor 2 family protein [Actinokineospora auranticolor]|uniref:Ketosteroid isomerase-like protein n=1 Tax=Actinokineospora auranticolor TaxID=155976 RepID=A0A2S6H0E7_9PSEU|nr:ester cyclase [Actinokineospora auranticolor]PPK70901.1 ketosteroid isomerase-like protein [Actinokineospora auranticolor]